MAKAASVFDEGKATATPATLQRLVAIGHETLEAEQAVAQLEDAIKIASQRLNELRMKTLPDLMAEVGVDEFKLPDGTKIAIKDFMAGSLPKEPEARAKAIGLIEGYGASALIKTEVSMAFGRSEHNIASNVIEELRGKGLNVDVQSGIHPATLQSFARERLKNGEPIDLEAIGLYAGRTAKVSPPKATKAGKL